MRVVEKGSIKPTKGDYKGHRWIIFDAVGPCLEDECPLFDLCGYEKFGKCSVEMKYTSAVFDSIMEDIGDKLTDRFLNKVSLHLMPLFGMLVKMKKVALSISNPTYETLQGAKKIHPIFREIREIISAIERTQRSMGLDGEYLQAKEIFRRGGEGPKDPGSWEKPSAEGDPSYVDELYKVESKTVEEELFPEGTNQHIKRARRDG